MIKPSRIQLMIIYYKVISSEINTQKEYFDKTYSRLLPPPLLVFFRSSFESLKNNLLVVNILVKEFQILDSQLTCDMTNQTTKTFGKQVNKNCELLLTKVQLFSKFKINLNEIPFVGESKSIYIFLDMLVTCTSSRYKFPWNHEYWSLFLIYR